MVIFPEVLGETEFSMFQQKEFEALSLVLDDTLAKYIKTYMENPEANPDTVESVKKNIGDLVTDLTLHQVLQERGITTLLASLSPESMLTSGADLKDIKEKLTFLEENVDRVRTVIMPRPKVAFEAFRSAMVSLCSRMKSEGVTPTFENIIARIDSNRFMFYVPNDKGHTTGVNIINSRRRYWTMCLRGLEYHEYCEQHGIDYIRRRVF